jgi:flagellar biosynthetic protein FliR
MNGTLLEALTPANLTTFAFVLTRVSGLMTVAPLWSMNGIPRQIRVAVTVLLSLVLLPLAPRVQSPDSLALLPVGMAVEFLLGLVIGLTAAVLVHGAAMAGEVLSLQMGLSLGPAVAPMTDVAVPGVGQFTSFLSLMVYVAVGGHLMLIRGVAESLTSVPPGITGFPGAASVGEGLLGTVYTTALATAAPAMVALLAVNVAVGITSRAVPQLPAILVLFPVTIGLGLFILALTLPALGTVTTGWMSELTQRVAGALHALVPAH